MLTATLLLIPVFIKEVKELQKAKVRENYTENMA